MVYRYRYEKNRTGDRVRIMMKSRKEVFGLLQLFQAIIANVVRLHRAIAHPRWLPKLGKMLRQHWKGSLFRDMFSAGTAFLRLSENPACLNLKEYADIIS
jgi:hypothetical protein